MCRPRSARSWKCCVPTHPLFSPMPRRGAAGTKNGSRCRPHAWTCAICPSRRGHAATAAPRRRQLLKLVKILPHPGLLVRRQFLELLPAAAQRMALLGGQPLPMRKALARLVALLGGHSQPAVGAVRERLLARGRQAVPLARVSRQELALLGREARPGERGRGSGTRRGRLLRNGGRLLCKRGSCRKQQQGDAGTRGVTHYFSL